MHVFSLASGLLYERMLRIMMASVLQRTKRKVRLSALTLSLAPALTPTHTHLPFPLTKHSLPLSLPRSSFGCSPCSSRRSSAPRCPLSRASSVARYRYTYYG